MSRARPSREQIIEQYRACVLKLGRAPGLSIFCKMAKVLPGHVFYYWPRISDLAKEAGAKPNKFITAIPEDSLFEDYARICLHLKKVPNRNELAIATRELGTRTSVLYKRFRSASHLDKRFREWLLQRPEELHEILSLPGWNRKGRLKPISSTITSHSFHPFLPACLQYLDALARGELPPHELSEHSVNVLFERRCGDAFRALGFEVTQLGQGKGRGPDLVATARRHKYGVIVDAKVRKDGYILGTDDRTFSEYVMEHTQRLNQDGIEKAYLVLVGSRFRETDLRKLAEYLAASEVRGITFFNASALMRVLEDSIRERASFTLGEFEKMLFGNRIVTS